MRKSVFKTPKDVLGMFEKRSSGFSYKRLAEYYGVDHTTIIYWCSRYGIKKHQPINLTKEIHITMKKRFPAPAPPIKGKYKDIIYEKVNEGKTYAEYLEEERRRKLKK